MPVEHGAYDGDEMDVQNGTVIDQIGRVALISDIERCENNPLNVIDSEPARMRMHDEVIDGQMHYTDMLFDSLNQARLAYGLWRRCGPFTQPEGSAVPAEVATDGQEAIAAYLRTSGGYPRSRSFVADMMDVRKATVSNYCNRVRWEPPRKREEQQLIDAVHTFDDQFTLDELEARVDATDDMTHTVISRMTRFNSIEKVDDDPDRWQVI